MTVDLTHSTSSARFSNAASDAGAATGGAIGARRCFSRLGRDSEPVALGYRREPIAVGSEFHTADRAGPSQSTGAHA